LPSELQSRVVAEVEQAKERSGMPVRQSLQALGVPVTSYYRWLREEAWKRETVCPVKPVQAFEALAVEKQAVKEYALEHPEVRHRELAWRMIDEDVAYLSPSTVYRILSEEDLMCRRPGRQKRYREEEEQATRPDEIWGTDFMYVTIGEHQFFLITFIDEYSRYLVHWELMSHMDGHSISQAAQAALETLPRDQEGKVTVQPIIRSDNGSGYISREFGGLLDYHQLTHRRIRPHCPEENGITERANRTLREYMDEVEVHTKPQAEAELTRIIDRYNHERLHSSLGFKPPVVYYRGDPAAVDDCRRLKLQQARHRRKEANLKIRQRTLPMQPTDN
jgi:transposase InsO family protein